ncbi:MAG: carbamoyltransferase C-terminal domain-containing protein, partial [Candidatus Omnitrophica bacterium]|nr:carbamoyltransferase C-terminal domain-containing protein [Candidatus Omnitrophota bacterium]
FLNEKQIPYSTCARNDIPDAVSDLIINGNVVGWFQGKMEFGPRALGARSIIADPRDPHMQSRLNMKIKFRESFRPFAPVVLKEHAAEWFDIDKESPYMLITAPVHADKRTQDFGTRGNSLGFDKLKIPRSSIPSVTHVDYSARIQSIDRVSNQLFYDTIDSFYRKTGCPVIINTSFNVRGEPLVCSPEDAFRCFMRTHMDYLVLGPFVLDKKKQGPVSETAISPGNFERD